MKTILITGCSSGFGLAIAHEFLARDWNVLATMRSPRNDLFAPSDRLRVLPLDVTDAASIRKLIDAAGPIDALVNNAGLGAASPAELAPMATMRDVFETNTFGTIAMMQAVIPQFRERKAGVIVNVSSSVTFKALPLMGVYRASKMAVNAFTEAAALELEPFGVRARLVLPGRTPETRFADNAHARMHGLDHPAYVGVTQQILAMLSDASSPTTRLEDVAAAVWRAVNDPACPVCITAGADAAAWAADA